MSVVSNLSKPVHATNSVLPLCPAHELHEAYEHAAETVERFALAQVVTDMNKKTQLDLNFDYFVCHRAETACLQRHQQPIRDIVNNQVKSLQRIYF